MDLKKNILEDLGQIKRTGIEKLLKYLEESSTFFKDPASPQGHNCYDGGLAKHASNVYNNLQTFKKVIPEFEGLEDSLKIIGYLHDFALIGSFQECFKNVPIQDAQGKNKKDEYNRLIFTEKKFYDFHCNTLPYPHGTLSCLLLKQYIKLTKLEDICIFWQKGIAENGNLMLMQRAQSSHPLVLYTYFAIKEAILYPEKGN